MAKAFVFTAVRRSRGPAVGRHPAADAAAGPVAGRRARGGREPDRLEGAGRLPAAGHAAGASGSAGLRRGRRRAGRRRRSRRILGGRRGLRRAAAGRRLRRVRALPAPPARSSSRPASRSRSRRRCRSPPRRPTTGSSRSRSRRARRCSSSAPVAVWVRRRSSWRGPAASACWALPARPSRSSSSRWAASSCCRATASSIGFERSRRTASTPIFDLVGGETVRALAGLAHDSSRIVSAADYAIAEIGGAQLEHPDGVASIARSRRTGRGGDADTAHHSDLPARRGGRGRVGARRGGPRQRQGRHHSSVAVFPERTGITFGPLRGSWSAQLGDSCQRRDQWR